MPAGEFKSRCLKVMDQVRATRQPVVITKRGRPVAKLVPLDTHGDDIFACLKGVVEYRRGHRVSPRLIAATARAEGMTLITRDQRIRQSPLVRTLW